MKLPFGTINGTTLEVRFSTADFSVATVIGGIREHLDMFEEMNVDFLGLATRVPGGNQPVMEPVNIVAHFEYDGSGDAAGVLGRVYRVLWKGIVQNFPDELEWSEAKANYSLFLEGQASMMAINKEK
jgi:hypothetical protein